MNINDITIQSTCLFLVTANLVMCLILAVVSHTAITRIPAMRTISRVLAIFALMNAIDSFWRNCITEFNIIVPAIDYAFLQYKITIECFLMSYVLIKWLRIPYRELRSMVIIMICILTFVMSRSLLFRFWTKDTGTDGNLCSIFSFYSEPEIHILSILGYVFLLLFTLHGLILAHKQAVIFRDTIRKHYTITERKELTTCTTALLLCLGYIILSSLYLPRVNATADLYVQLLTTLMLLTLPALALTYRDALTDMYSFFKEAYCRFVVAEECACNQCTPDVNIEGCKIVSYAIEKWIESPDNPLNRENLTISDMSRETHLPMSIIARYLMKFHTQTFHQWVREMRAKE